MNYISKILNLSLQLSVADFKLKNEGSYLGILWYILNPLLIFGLLLLIFNNNFGSVINKYPLYLFIGILIINLFQNVTSESISSIISDNKYIIKSINFQKETLIFSIVLKNIMSHFFEMLILIILLIYTDTNLLFMFAWLLIMFLYSIFLTGAGLILSSLTVFFIDLNNIWNFLLRILWFITPIFYNSDITYLNIINHFNPLYYFIQAARVIMIDGSVPSIITITGLLLLPLITIIAGVMIFNKIEPKMAEKI